MKGRLQHIGFAGRICLFLLVMLLTTAVAIGLWAMMTGGSQTVESLKLMQMLQTVGTFMLPCFICAALWSEEPIRWLSLNRGIDWKESLLTIVLMLCASPFINLLAYLNEQLVLPDFLSGLEQLMRQQEEAAAALTEKFIRADSIGVLLFNIVLMALLPAFSEEICFRGVLQRLFADIKHNRSAESGKQLPHIAIWVTAIIFSAIHFQFYGFIPRMLIGALLGYMLCLSGSLWLPVLAHFTNNATAVILYNIYYMRGNNPDEIDSFGTGDTLWVGIVSAVLTIGLTYLLLCMLKKRNEEVG